MNFIKVLPFIFLCFLITSCNKKTEYVNHLKNTTLKLAPAVQIKIDVIEQHPEFIKLHPNFTTQKSLSHVQLKWLVEINEEEPSLLLEQDFSREDFTEEKLKSVQVDIIDPSLNHKVVLIVHGISDGKEFSLTAIYNSLFQKEIDDAKERLLERSSRQVIQGKREYQD